MANALCFTLVSSFNSNSKPGLLNGSSNARKFIRVDDLFGKSRTAKFQSVQPKAADSSKSSKPSSIVCVDCDGNGAVLCSQCQGSGVNSVDHFNGQFKAGGLCWLCRFLWQSVAPCAKTHGGEMIGSLAMKWKMTYLAMLPRALPLALLHMKESHSLTGNTSPTII